MDPHREFPDDPQPRWYGGDADRGGGGMAGRPDDGGARVPAPRSGDLTEPRDPTTHPPYAPNPGLELRRPEDSLFGGRYAGPSGQSGPAGPATEQSFPGFAPARLPDPGRLDSTWAHQGQTGSGAPHHAAPTYRNPAPTPLSPAGASPYPGIPPVVAADAATTAERQRALDLPPISAGPAGQDAAEQPPRFRAEPIDRAALRRPTAPIAPVGDGLYRTRRPAVALLFAMITVIFEVPAARLLVEGAFGARMSVGAVVAGTSLMLALPAFGLGSYALVTGAGRQVDAAAATPWLRPPLAYLTMALVLFLAAGLAAG